MTLEWEKVFLLGQIGTNIKENLIKTKSMAKVHIHGPMVTNIKEIGSMMSKQVKVYLLLRMEICMKGNG